MAETAAKPCANAMIPMAQVMEVQRAIDFYKLLGMEVRNTVKNPDGKLQWAHVACAYAHLMLARIDEPLAAGQGVTFYFYSPDLVALREHLLAHGVKVSEITYPFYMEKGEICLNDPDGYTLLIGQAG